MVRDIPLNIPSNCILPSAHIQPHSTVSEPRDGHGGGWSGGVVVVFDRNGALYRDHCRITFGWQ